MPWLEYEVDQDDPVALAEWETAVAEQEPAKEGEEPKESPPKPELQHVTKQIEVESEVRLVLVPVGGAYQNLAMGEGGVTSAKIIDPPAEETPPAGNGAAATSSKSSKSS